MRLQPDIHVCGKISPAAYHCAQLGSVRLRTLYLKNANCILIMPVIYGQSEDFDRG